MRLGATKGSQLWLAWPATWSDFGHAVKISARRTLTGVSYAVKSRFAQVNERPIIILGNQKSGTSAIAHLLADFGSLSKTIDIRPLWPPSGVEIMRGQLDFATVVERHRAYFASDVIKEPMMTFFAEQVTDRFPRGRFVFVVRDPRDNIRSLLNSRDIPGHLQKIERCLVPASPPHNVVVDAGVWGGEQENYIGVLAHRWMRSVDSYLQDRDNMILARYEDFGRDKKQFIAKLAGQLDIQERNDISSKIDLQYQPAGDASISWPEFFGVGNLERIQQLCGSRMTMLGYPPTSPAAKLPGPSQNPQGQNHSYE